MDALPQEDDLTAEQKAMFVSALRYSPRSTKDLSKAPDALPEREAADTAIAAVSTDRAAKVAFSSNLTLGAAPKTADMNLSR